ncbi:MAG TPA: hypothetical protein VNT26_22975, partial [Candidatus Sulfotelmatobacter sp.]|nr:hypothetical protein [Candidatus Sulfotelmatobacter sp.]
MQKLSQLINLVRRQPRWRLFALLAVLLGAAGLWFWRSGAKSASSAPNFVARRGPLEISILEGGSLQALESQESKCEVRVGYQGTKILKIVDEGYQVTEEDVQNGKVLVELDSSELQKQIVQQEIQYQTALATLIDAQQNYEIQLSQNDSDIKAAAQKVRFARMDFDKFLGDTVTARIITQVGLDKLAAAASTNNVEQTSHAAAAFAAPAAPSSPSTNSDSHLQGLAPAVQPAVFRSTNGSGGFPLATASANAMPATAEADLAEALESLEPEPVTNDIVVDFSQYAKIEVLGDGEAKQKLRKFEDDFQVSQKELGQAQSTLEGTQRLFNKGFVTKTDQERDEIAFENSRLKVQTAQSARDLFLKYDFLRSAEDALSKYAEAVREFDKARRVAISKRAQARARLKSAQGQYQIQSRQRNDL